MDILLASPRGFCAGVERAILIVEKALEKFGSPVYVRHEIVHNKSVVENLSKKGAFFIDEVDEAPKGAVVIFSAHGVPKRVYAESEMRKLIAIDATCPLVTKVHTSIANQNHKSAHIILIGHSGHPEVEGSLGQLSEGEMTLVSTPEEVDSLQFKIDDKLAYTTQTTLSIGETKDIIDALKKKYPNIQGPPKGDLCYATTNRQEAVEKISKQVQLLLIIGSQNSSNSNRLKELGERNGVSSYLIDSKNDIEIKWFDDVSSVGISSGASAPEYLVEEVVSWITHQFPKAIKKKIVNREENVKFKLPSSLG